MFLGLDLGTTNIKAVVVESGGRIAAAVSAPVTRYYVGQSGVEQNIDEIWNAAKTTIRAVAARVDSSKIRALGVSSQGAAVQVLDSDNRPIGRIVSWLDARGRPYDAAFTNEMGEEFFARRVGHGLSELAIGQLLRLKKESPGVLDRPTRIGFVGDMIVGRLCGSRVHDATSLAIALLYNPWLERSDPEIMARIGLEDSQLPCLSSATVAAGTLQDNVAAELGLPAGIPVSPAVHDQYAASLGAASVSKGDVNFSAGTAWVLLANSDKLTPPVAREAYVCRHPVEGLFGQMLSMICGGSSIQWAMNLCGMEHADSLSVDQLIDESSPGAGGLRYWPRLSNGSHFGPDSPRGRLSGIGLSHQSADLIRAVIEGLACDLSRQIDKFTRAGIRVERLVMCGSAAMGRHTPQIIADVTLLPVVCVETPDIGAMGAAMLARSLVDRDLALADIAREWAPPRLTIDASENAKAYPAVYEEFLSAFEETSNMNRSERP